MHVFIPNLALCNMRKIKLRRDEINTEAPRLRAHLLNPFLISFSGRIELSLVFQIVVLHFLTRKD